jgi:multidrug efflux pump subunit AcrB
MNPIVFALRHPVTVMVGIVAVVIGSAFAYTRMKIDVFPNLNLPVIYVSQPYGGMDATQMEGLLANYYETTFFYVSGIDHIESKNIQGMTLMKLYFEPGTDMSQALSEVVSSVNRARFLMPQGTVPPSVLRFDTGSAVIGYLVMSSEKRPIKEIQDLAVQRVRPMFASIPGISAPPAFGGNARGIIINVDPDRLRSNHLTPDDVVTALINGNPVMPSGNIRIGDRMLSVPTNALVGNNPVQELGEFPVRLGPKAVYIRDVMDPVKKIEDGADTTAGYVLVNGTRSVYLMATKRAEASTLSVIDELKKSLPRLKEQVPEDVKLEFAFDQSPVVRDAMFGVAMEGVLGALLTGLMVLVFLRDPRSVIVVVCNIPLAILAALIGLWLTGQSINLMTLGGLALAVGILVDESTVEVENIHTQMMRASSIARAVRLGNSETAVPRLLAMLCILAVFIPSAFMEGSARALFAPLSLAVGFAMIASYILSSTFVPVMSVWLLRHTSEEAHPRSGIQGFRRYGHLLMTIVRMRHLVVPVFLGGTTLIVIALGSQIGTEIFPQTDKGQFQLRLRAPTGTTIERTEELAKEALRFINEEAGPGNVELTVGYIGMFPSNYSIQAIYQWTNGPEEAALKVALKPGSGIRLDDLKHRLRQKLPEHLKNWLTRRWTEEGLTAKQIDERLPGLRYSFEPADIINEVMSFGSPTPIEIAISGVRMEYGQLTAPSEDYVHKVRDQLSKIGSLRDLQIVQAMDYPAIEVRINRQQAGMAGVTAMDVTRSVLVATASSRFVSPNLWYDRGSGQSYLVQVQVPIRTMRSIEQVEMIPVKGRPTSPGNGVTGGMSATAAENILVRDVATVRERVIPGEIDRYNMRRTISLVANIEGEDMGRVDRKVRAAIADAGTPPRGVTVRVRGQLAPMEQIFNGLTFGLIASVVVIFLLLTAYFQSARLALCSVAAVPAALAGVALMLFLTGTTLNLQSFTGTIMTMGVTVANAILLVTFAERERLENGGNALDAAVEGGRTRLRPILMTSCAMIVGMVPMALGIGDGGDQTAPLGRAVIGGLLAATAATLFLLPAVFAMVQRKTGIAPASLDPDDPESACFDGATSPG